MRPFRFLHTADLHLGTPFLGLSTDLPADWRQTLKSAAEGVFRRIVDAAIRERVDFVTIAGDLFDTEDARMSVQFELMRGFERLREHNIPVFLCHGNHDPLVGTRTLTWPDNVHVFAAAPVNVSDDYSVPSTVIQLDETRIQISGFSYPTAALYTSYASYFTRLSSVDFAIGLYHGTIGSDTGHANYCPVRTADLAQRGFDFWGLGHIHKPQVIRPENPTILYPGNPQGRHIREDGRRGCTIVDVSQNKVIQTNFLPIAAVQWERLQVSAEECSDIADFRNHALAAIAVMLQEHSLPMLLRIVVTGNTDVHAELQSREIKTILQDDIEIRHWPVYIECIEVLTAPAVDEQALLLSSSYQGEVLRLLEQYRTEPNFVRSTLLPELKDVFHAGNGLAIDELSDEYVAELIAGARRRLLKYVVPEREAKE